MRYGIAMFPTDYAIPVTELGRACEDLGFESLFFPEHTHIPASRKTPWPGGAPLPEEYSHTLDPFVAMSAAAAVTSTLKVGTGICLVMRARPDHAREGGRERRPPLGRPRCCSASAAAGTARRWRTTARSRRCAGRSCVSASLAMKRIWTEDDAEFHGEYVDFDPLWSWPKPVQKPHPPILVGGDGPRTLQRVVEFGDEWMPIGGRGSEDLKSRIDELQAMAKDAGRQPIPVGLFGARPRRRRSRSTPPRASAAASSTCRPSRATKRCRGSSTTRS